MQNNQRYEVLDGLRGICALFVCILHARIFSHLYDLDFIRNAYLFVDFFFVLSGFVICISYRHKLNAKKDIYNFTVKRIGRIWPLHLLMLFSLVTIEFSKYYLLSNTQIGSETSAFVARFSIESLFANIFLIHSVGFYDYLTWNNPSWSISVEFWTYMVFALTVFFFRAKLKYFTIAIAILSLLALWLFAPKNMDVTYDYGLIRCFSGFFVGVFICLYRTQLMEISFYKACLVELLIILGIYLFISEWGANKLSLLSPLVFGVAVWFFSYEKGYISTLLKKNAIQKLGILSFTLYMVHSVVLTVLWRINTLLTQDTYIVQSTHSHGYSKIINYGHAYLGDIFLLLYILFVIAVSTLIYRFYEEPLRIKFNRLANRKF